MRKALSVQLAFDPRRFVATFRAQGNEFAKARDAMAHKSFEGIPRLWVVIGRAR